MNFIFDENIKLYIGKIFFLLVIISLFLVIPLIYAIQNGLSCYDDTGYAIIAKNLATGLGYATTISYVDSNFTVSSFDYAIGQGPIGILPVALAFKLFGVNPLLPGIVQVVFEFMLLAFIVLFLLKDYGFLRTSCFLCSSLLLITLISGWHYEHWYAMLGESIAALFVILGFIVLQKYEISVRYSILGGFFLALAAMTKEISAIFTAVFAIGLGLAFIVACVTRPNSCKHNLKSLCCFALAGLTPVIAFEIWRLIVLGWQGFLVNWQQHLAFISTYSPQHDVSNTILQNFAQRTDVFKGNFYISILVVIVSNLFAYMECFFSKQTNKYVVTIFEFAILFYFVYWIFLTIGPARHLYVLIVVACFFVSLPLLLQKNMFIGVLPALFLLIFLVPRAGNDLVNRIVEVDHSHIFQKPTREYVAERQMLAFIDTKYPESKILTPWWAHVAMLEFFSSRPALFSGWDSFKQHADNLVLIDSKTASLVKGEPEKDALILKEHDCTELYDAAPYRLYLCPKPAPPTDLGDETP